MPSWTSSSGRPWGEGRPRVPHALGLGTMAPAIFGGMVLGGPAAERAQGRLLAALMAAMALPVATTAFPAWRGAPAALPMGRDGTGLGALSERERGVLRLLAQGFSNKEFAQQLPLWEATVPKHLERIYRKPAVAGRAAAVARYLREGRAPPRTGAKARVGRGMQPCPPPDPTAAYGRLMATPTSP